MPSSKRRPNLKKIIAALRIKAAAGDLSAMCELGMWMQGGYRDKTGRVIVRNNPNYAFRLFKRAAAGGYKDAAASLGFAYDNGLGTKRNRPQAVRWYMADYRNGRTTGAANLATVYRDQGDLQRALAWWMRASDLGDGDALVDAGYCYQYGIGTRKSTASARRLFRRALAARDISMWGREEALYHLAVSHIDAGKPRLALPLLKRAAKDGDYPEADMVLEQIGAKGAIVPCRCRRFINKDLRGHAVCAVHSKRPGL